MDLKDVDLIGKYKNFNDASHEVLKLKKDYKIESTFQSRLFVDGRNEIKFYEDGEWETNGDTLIIIRDRNRIIKDWVSEIDSFLIREDTLFWIRRNFKNEISISSIFFEKQ